MLLRRSSVSIIMANVVMTFVPSLLSSWCCLAHHAAQALIATIYDLKL